MIIRDESPADIDAITEVTEAAFRTLSVSEQTEHFIIAALRASGGLAISLVAEIDGRVTGHIAFSPVTISDGTAGWYGLGPVSVLPEQQGRGIGRSLVEEGLSRLRKMGARGCVLVGDPGYYERFGFRSHPRLVHEGVPREVFLALSFSGELPEGTVSFHKAFTVRG